MLGRSRGGACAAGALVGTVLLGAASSRAAVDVDLQWRPQIQSAAPNSIVELELYAVKSTSGSRNIEGVQVILDWDPTRLRLVGLRRPCGTCSGGSNGGLFCDSDSDCPGSVCGGSNGCFECPDPSTYNWFSASFPNDCNPGDSINAPCPGFPSNDGNAFFASFSQVLCNGEPAESPIVTNSPGLHVISFQFEVLANSGGALVDITPSIGSTTTLVAGGAPDDPGTNVLRQIGSAAQINIVQCQPPAVAESAGPRYLKIEAASGTSAVALQVLGDSADPNVGCVSGYVQTPVLQCVGGSFHRNSCTGDADCPGGACQRFAVLGTNAVRITPAEWGTVYVRGSEIHPSKIYTVRQDCGTAAGANVSTGVTVPVWLWGDVDRDAKCTGGTNAGAPCDRPDQCPGGTCLGVDVIDITKIVDAFRGFYSATLTLPSTDLAGANCVPNVAIDVIDVTSGVDAFRGLPFRCTAPPCP